MLDVFKESLGIYTKEVSSRLDESGLEPSVPAKVLMGLIIALVVVVLLLILAKVLVGKKQIFYFWKRFLLNPVRLISFVIFILAMTSYWIEMLFLILVLIVASNMADKYGLLEQINWNNKIVQLVATLIMVFVTGSSVIALIGTSTVIKTIFTVLIVIIGIVFGVKTILKIENEANKNNDNKQN